MTANLTEIEAVREVILRTAVLLDDEDFEGWLKLFETDGIYELSAFSTEIRRWMTWQHSDRAALEKMLGEVEEHVRDSAKRRHVVGNALVEIEGDRSRARSPFSLFRTSPEGQSSLYIVGCYEDQLVKRSSGWLYTVHKVIVDTRMLDAFTHVPI